MSREAWQRMIEVRFLSNGFKAQYLELSNDWIELVS